MSKTKYAITTISEGFAPESRVIDVKNDKQARAAGISAAEAADEDSQVYVEFSNDRSSGYINRDGADVTGKAY